MPNGSETPVIPKREESRDDVVSSLESAQDEDQQFDLPEGAGQNNVAGGSPVQKRKGGRKPLYQTTEEKKQRNRRAQAAFRERRTEHIKTLEADKKQLEDRVESMEAGQRKDKDENLMLRYKNSLLERILVEHKRDIDFRSEIEQNGSAYSPPHVPRSTTQMPPHRPVYHRPRPKPLAVDTRTPQPGRSDSNATASAASSSPIIPPSGPFTYRSPVQMPLSASQQLPPGQSPFIPNLRQTESVPNLPHPSLSRRRQSTHNTWPSGFDTALQQQPSSFALEGSNFPIQSASPLLQQHFSDPSNSSQFGMLSTAQFQGGAGSIGQVMDTGSAGASTLSPPNVPQSGNMDRSYGLMGGDMSSYVPVPDADPFGIDRSMQYPTQFDFATGQRKQQE